MSSSLSPTALALCLAANAFYDAQNTRESRKEIESQLASYARAPAQAAEAALAALRAPELLSASAQVLVLSVLERALAVAFPALPDAARAEVFSQLRSMALPEPGVLPAPPQAAVAVAAKVLARVVAQLPPASHVPFVAELCIAAARPEGSAGFGRGSQYALALLHECLVQWLDVGRSPAAAAATRGAREAILLQLPAIVRLLSDWLSAPPAATTQPLASLELLAGALPEAAAAANLLSPHLLAALASLSGAAVASDAPAVSQDAASSALTVLAALVQRGIVGANASQGIRAELVSLAATLLSSVVGEPPTLSTASEALDAIEPACAFALREFVIAAVARLLPAIEAADTAFPTLRLCQLLFVYTLAQPGADSFVALLQLWGALVDADAARADGSSAGAGAGVGLSAAFSSLAAQLLERVLYSTNAACLDALNDEVEHDDDFDSAGGYRPFGAAADGGEAATFLGVQMSFTAASSPPQSLGPDGSIAPRALYESLQDAGGMDDGGDEDSGGAGPPPVIVGPPTVHRLSSRSRTLPSTAYSARPIRVNILAAGGGDAPVAATAAAAAAAAASLDADDEDDELGQASALATGTVLADADDGSCDEALDRLSAAAGSSMGDGAASGAVDGGRSGGATSERSRYVTAALLLLSKLAALPAVSRDVLAKAGVALQTACAALHAAAACVGSCAPDDAATLRPPPLPREQGIALQRACSDVVVIFALLADAGPASVLAAGADARLIMAAAAAVLQAAAEQGWAAHAACELPRVAAAALVVLRAFLPLLDVAAAGRDGDGGTFGVGAGGLSPVDAAALLNGCVGAALHILGDAGTNGGVATEAAVALLVAASQLPRLRPLLRSSAVPAMQALLLPAADGGAAGKGWTQMIASLPARLQAHALLAGLRMLLCAAPVAAASSSDVHVDLPADVRTAAAAALLQPHVAAVGDAAAALADGTTAGAAPQRMLARGVGLCVAALGAASEPGGLGAALQQLLASALAPAMSQCPSAVSRLLAEAEAGAEASMHPARLSPFRAPSSGGGGVGGGAVFGGSSSAMPLVSAAELLRLLAAAVAALRRQLPDSYLVGLLDAVGPLLPRLVALAGDSGASRTAAADAAAAGAPSPPAPSLPLALQTSGVGRGIRGGSAGGSGSAGGVRTPPGLLAAQLYLVRLLRSCCLTGAAPARVAGATTFGASDASARLRATLLGAATGPLLALALPGGSRFAEELSPAVMLLCRAILRAQWPFLLPPRAAAGAFASGGAIPPPRDFFSAEATAAVEACASLPSAWLASTSASPELARFALLTHLALQRELGAWRVPSFISRALPAAEAALLDALCRGGRPTLADESLRALVDMAASHRADFASRVLPAWMSRTLGEGGGGAAAVSALVAGLDPAVAAALADENNSPTSARDYGEALLAVITAVGSWTLIRREAVALARGETVPAFG